MAEIETFQGFFSYAHHTAHAHPQVVEAFACDLERLVSEKLTNANLQIWRDTDRLRNGEQWDERLGEEVRKSHVLIVLLTPKWIESDYCRKEFKIFRDEVEPLNGSFGYVFVIRAGELDDQVKHFDAEQKADFALLRKRQYQTALASEFISMPAEQRNVLLGKLADDLASMIERVRSLQKQKGRVTSTPAANKRAAVFQAQAHDVETVGLLTGAEVVIDKPKDDGPRAVLAHVGFIERLYMQTERGRCEFGVSRFYLSLEDGGSGALGRIDSLRVGADRSIHYVDFKPCPGALTVSVSAPGGGALGPLPMAPAPNENYLANVATLSAGADLNQLRARLSIVLKPEGLFLFDDRSPKPSERRQRQIAAIAAALCRKEFEEKDHGRLERDVPVSARE